MMYIESEKLLNFGPVDIRGICLDGARVEGASHLLHHLVVEPGIPDAVDESLRLGLPLLLLKFGDLFYGGYFLTVPFTNILELPHFLLSSVFEHEGSVILLAPGMDGLDFGGEEPYGCLWAHLRTLQGLFLVYGVIHS